MDFEERINRLVERHEALAQTVEHLALQGEEQRKTAVIQSATMEKLVGNTDKLVSAISQITESIRSLANIAQAHESRLSRIEGRDTGSAN